MITEQEHLRLAEAKMDASWERYHAGRVDLVDRYDVTVALVGNRNLLDVGCGQGLLCALVKEKHPNSAVTGIDISVGEIAAARKCIGQHNCGFVELIRMDIEKSVFANEERSCVVLGQTLEHVRYPDKAADEVLRILKSGGRLIVNVPCDDEQPHGNHLHVYRKPGDIKDLFGDAMNWQGEGRMHNFWFLWGEKK